MSLLLSVNRGEDEGRFDRWKRLSLLIILLLGVGVLVLSWWMGGAGDSFIAYMYPVCAVLMTVLAVLLVATRLSLTLLTRAAFVLAVGLVLARLAWHYHFAGPIENTLLPLVGGHYWAVAVIMVASFVFFDRYQGLAIGTAILLVAGLIALSGLGPEWRRGVVSDRELVFLLRVHLFLIMLLALSSITSIAQVSRQRALIRADMLEGWANTDALTGLPNRRAADRALRARLAEAMRHGRPLAVIMLDVDHFKAINDAQGHLKGDEVLKALGMRVRQCLRETDMLARWGGEEFLIVAPETDADSARRLAERCLGAVTRSPLADTALSATFGVTGVKAGDDVESLVGRADAALYDGKNAGRNRVVVQ